MTPSPSPPSSTPWRPSGKLLANICFCELLWGGDPLSPPLQHALAACGRSGPFGGIFGEKKNLKFLWGGRAPRSSPPPLQHPLAACGRSGPFGAPSGHALRRARLAGVPFGHARACRRACQLHPPTHTDKAGLFLLRLIAPISRTVEQIDLRLNVHCTTSYMY